MKWLEFTNVFPTLTSDEVIEKKCITNQETKDVGKKFSAYMI